jgi:hypothetical protein
MAYHRATTGQKRRLTARTVLGYTRITNVGAWRSLVARTVRVGEVVGSNPAAPTTKHSQLRVFFCFPHTSRYTSCAILLKIKNT